MQELIKLVVEKTGIPEDKARVAIETVLGYLKGNLPAGVATQLDSVAAGGGTNLGDMAGKFMGG